MLFRGGAEGSIRRNLVRQGFIKGIIGLPANLFFGTGIPACIVFIDKEHARARKGVFMLDASQGFRKDGHKNRLRAALVRPRGPTRLQPAPGGARRLWVNLELAKKPVPCLEYIVVHELVHLLARHHNDQFMALMDKHLPQWRLPREELNRAPLGHVTWEY